MKRLDFPCFDRERHDRARRLVARRNQLWFLAKQELGDDLKNHLHVVEARISAQLASEFPD